MITPFLCSVFMISMISCNVVKNTSMSAVGAVLGLYITPTIVCLLALDMSSMNNDSKT